MNVAVVHAHRHCYSQHALGKLDHLPCIVVEAQGVRRGVKILQSHVVGVVFEFCCEHCCLSLPAKPEKMLFLTARKVAAP